ncbi:MAG TPA: hypothetical protein VJB59_11840 [Bdellovibrionota bacterium]|nr:hypothetical protein [Bdellovibrionota bacterium]
MRLNQAISPFIIIAAILLTGTGVPQPARAGFIKNCISRFLKQSTQPRSYETLLSIINGSDKNIPATWSPTWWENPDFSGLAKLTDGLNEAEKYSLHHALRNTAHPYSRNELILLAMGDQNTWERFFDRIIKEGSPQPIFSTRLAPFIDRLSPEVMASLQKRIQTLYSDPHLKKTIHGSSHRGPKRLADDFIRASVRADRIIPAYIKRGLTPLEAYDNYLREIRSRFYPKNPKHGDKVISDKSVLDASQLLQLAKTIQKELRSESNRLGPMKSRFVRLFGSTVNGMRRPGSDLDAMAPTEHFLKLQEPLTQQFQKELGEMKRERGLYLNIQNLGINNATDPESAGRVFSVINPVMIRVTPEQIDLMIYPARFSQLADQSGPQRLSMTITADPPFEYVLSND